MYEKQNLVKEKLPGEVAVRQEVDKYFHIPPEDRALDPICGTTGPTFAQGSSRRPLHQRAFVFGGERARILRCRPHLIDVAENACNIRVPSAEYEPNRLASKT